MPEAGRAVIKARRQSGGQALPRADSAAFAKEMLTMDIAHYQQATAMEGPVFMDRGIPDVIGYLNLCGLHVPGWMESAATQHRYNRNVFLAPFWSRIYEQDAERKQDLAEAKATCKVMQQVYKRLGYNLIPLPFADIETRTGFIRRHIMKIA